MKRLIAVAALAAGLAAVADLTPSEVDEYVSVTMSENGEKEPAGSKGAASGATLTPVTVDQHGNISHPDVVATVSDVARARAQAEIAEAAANAAVAAAEEIGRVVDQALSSITAGKAVIYRSQWVDSFGTAVVISEGNKPVIYEFSQPSGVDNATKTIDGTAKTCKAWDLYFGFKETIGTIVPRVRVSSDLGTATADWTEWSAVDNLGNAPSYTDADDITYSFCYHYRVWIPTDWNAQFVIVYVNGESAEGDGSTLDIVGGITGFESRTLTTGNLEITITGGLVTGVVDNGE